MSGFFHFSQGGCRCFAFLLLDFCFCRFSRASVAAAIKRASTSTKKNLSLQPSDKPSKAKRKGCVVGSKSAESHPLAWVGLSRHTFKNSRTFSATNLGLVTKAKCPQ